jgi:uncharacterized protein (DUF58 family)
MSLRQNAMWLILLTGILAIVGIWTATPELRNVWALPAALLLSGLAYEAAMLSRCPVGLELQAPEYWPLGRAQEVRYVFQQHARRELAIQVVLSAPEEFAAQSRIETLQLIDGRPDTVALTAAPRRMGRHSWPTPTLRIGGALRLAWWSRRVSTECKLTVVPDVVGTTDQSRAEQGAGARPLRAAGAGAEVLQLREYRRGDPLRAIDWKATARRGRLVSRDVSEDQHLEVMVAVDAGRASGLGADDVDRLSLYVNVAARFAERAAALDDAVGLVIYAAQPLAVLAPARGEAAVGRIRDLLTACRVQQSESNPVVAAARIHAIAQRRSLILFLTDLEDASAGEQLAKAVRILTPKHLPFIAGFQSTRIEALARAAAQEPLGAYRALAAVEYVNTVAGNVRALRALGAAALTARAADLDRAVMEAYRQFREQRRI